MSRLRQLTPETTELVVEPLSAAYSAVDVIRLVWLDLQQRGRTATIVAYLIWLDTDGVPTGASRCWRADCGGPRPVRRHTVEGWRKHGALVPARIRTRTHVLAIDPPHGVEIVGLWWD